ncbi:hypothetical protein PTT36_13245 [Serratia nevei]|uniref:hypothetical protein n=1 Tax=Serratia nevei TaxID=2703794 RepID=UPI00313F3558
MDNKLSELKRRADKCPIKRFKAFIGRANTQATLCADTGIEIIGWSGFDASDLNAKSHRVELARFIAAADPETILALLADNEHLARELVARNGENEWLRKRAAELEAKDERIGELEAEITNIVDSHAETVAELRAKLATPVRLPTTSGRLGVAYTRVIPEVIEAIRAAGFTVEGDE